MAASQGDVIMPAFNHMMSTNAAITIIEFKTRLKDARETLVLMKKFHRSVEMIRNSDEVIGWAVRVLEAAAGGNSPGTMQLRQEHPFQ
jgi:hypothetical protein